MKDSRASGIMERQSAVRTPRTAPRRDRLAAVLKSRRQRRRAAPNGLDALGRKLI